MWPGLLRIKQDALFFSPANEVIVNTIREVGLNNYYVPLTLNFFAVPWHWGWFSIFSKHTGSGAAARLFYHTLAIPGIVSRINCTCVPSSAMPWNERSRWSFWGMVNVLFNCYLVTDIWFLFFSCLFPNCSCSIRFRLPRWMCVKFFFSFPCNLLCWWIFQVWISITAYLHFICQSSQDKKGLAERIGEWGFYFEFETI